MLPVHADLLIPFGSYALSFSFDPRFFCEERAWSSYRHNHAGFEVHYILEGGYDMMAGAAAIHLEEGSLLMIPPNLYHAPVDLPVPKTVRRCTFQFSVYEKSCASVPGPSAAEAAHIVETLQAFQPCKALPLPALRPILSHIQTELEQQLPGYLTKISAYFLLLLTEISRAISPPAAGLPARPCAITEEQRATTIDAFFNFNYNRYGTETELASLLFVSRRNLNRILRKLYQKSFREKLLETRMEVANDLLKTTSFSNEKIAEQLGYRSESAFYLAYKKFSGTTPERYRLSAKPPKSPC